LINRKSGMHAPDICRQKRNAIYSFYQSIFMARQDGIIPLKGSIENLTFFKTKDGYLARKRNGPDANRIATDPAFQRTRENLAEFGRAGKAGKLFRSAFRNLIQNISDKRSISRLIKELMKVIKADVTSERGYRNVKDGKPELLYGFEFNANSQLATTFTARYEFTRDRVNGELLLYVNSFTPTESIILPTGATHFKIISATALIDFDTNSWAVDSHSSAVLPWNSTEINPGIEFPNHVTPNSILPMFTVLGIEFYQQVNGKNYPLLNGAYSALAIVDVNTV